MFVLSPWISLASVITDWNERALSAIRTSATPPPKASRNLAILHVSIFDAVNGIQPHYHHYLVPPRGPQGASKQAAAVVAAHDTLVALFPALAAGFDTFLGNDLAAIPNGLSKEAGVSWGRHVAAKILANRSNDGSTEIVAFTPVLLPGKWRPTLPAFGAALLPGWGDVDPFGINNVQRFLPSPPPLLRSAAYAAEVNFTKEIGSANSTRRTADQTLIARFWADGSGTATPPGHWNQVAQVLIKNERVNFEGQARLFALLNIAEADAAIVCWKAKYRYNFWRPITAIREANSDNNPATTADSTWTPLLATPPFPEYTSGHSTFSGAAVEVLGRFFGTDHIAFSVSSDGVPGTFRRFNTISSAADESGMSRIYGGIHFMSGNIAGLESGMLIGRYVAKRLLLPLNSRRVYDDDDVD